MKTPTTLIIMDGFGLNDKTEGNAVKAAKTPVLDRLLSENAHTALSASGSDVGLPEGQMGNSEVGHTNIGSGRVVFQDLPRISKAIEDGDFFENKAYNAAMDACLEQGTALHLLGLLSDGGVHSHITHLFALLELAKRKGLTKVYVHAFLDGRDVPPASGKAYVQQLADRCAALGVGKIATVQGLSLIHISSAAYAADAVLFVWGMREERKKLCLRALLQINGRIDGYAVLDDGKMQMGTKCLFQQSGHTG